MENKLIIFDPAERTIKDISNICLKFDKPIIISENLKSLENYLREGHKPLVTEFNGIYLESENKINSFLNILKECETPTIIHTNSQMYKRYLDELDKTKVYSIIRKIPRVGEPILRKHIEFLLSEKDYEGIIIIDSERAETKVSGRVFDSNSTEGYKPYYTRSFRSVSRDS